MNAASTPSGSDTIATNDEDEADERNDNELLSEFLRQIAHRSLDQLRAVVGLDDLDAFREAAAQHLEFRAHCLNRLKSVLARTHDDDPARDLTLSVELGDPTAQLRADLQPCDVFQLNRNAIHGGAQRDLSEVIEIAQIAGRPHHVFRLGEFEHGTTGFLIRCLNSLDHLAMRDPIGTQPIRPQDHLVLAYSAAKRGDLRDIGYRLELVFQKPVLNRTQLRDVVPTRAVDERVFVNPANTGRVRTQRRPRGARQPVLYLAQVLEHTRACPIEIRAVLEQHVHEGVAEERIATDGFRAGHGEHCRGERVRHLVLDDARRLSGVLCADDDLHIRKVRQCIDGRAKHAPHAPRSHKKRPQQHKEAILERPADERRDHGFASVLCAFSNTVRLSI